MKNQNEAAVETIKAAALRWQTTFIPRREVPVFTGGLYSTGHMANCDSRGEGVKGAFRISRQVCIRFPL